MEDPCRIYSKYARVILEIAVDKVLDYGIPENLLAKAHIGSRVEVFVRGREQHGYIIDIAATSSVPRVAPIISVQGTTPLFTKELMQLSLWMAHYYCTPLHQVFTAVLPASLRKGIKQKEQLFVMRAKTKDELKSYCEKIRNKFSKQAEILDQMLLVRKGILLSELLEASGQSRSPVDSLVEKGYLLLESVKVDRSPLVNEEYFQTKPKKLNTEQEEALDRICKDIKQGSFNVHLIHGITGSGKTEVYLQAIDAALRQNERGSILMLVPEIALTPQTIERFRSRFSEPLSVLHHRLSQGERHDEWHKIHRGEARIVIGARSAVFSPLLDPKLIIVDEEHESSYKNSEEMPCYNARDIAVMRGKNNQCPVILGSATPSLESYHNAMLGKYILSTLSLRADKATLPTVQIVDMRVEYQKAKGYTNFSEVLLSEIKKKTAVGEQVILFLNRRGYHTTIHCLACGESIRCAHCAVALTYHLQNQSLSCHLCGYSLQPPPRTCPHCHSDHQMKFKGVGTENIEASLHAILPDIRTIRIDADTTKHKGSHQKLLKEFGSGKADVLIGTQMIAKGLHFPSVSLVGIINCDTGLNIPDFRASESTFQVLTQVAGRAGRGSMPGKVIFQTSMPENSTIRYAASQDYLDFYQEEIASRQLLEFPPLWQLIKCVFSSKDPLAAQEAAQKVFQFLQRELPPSFLFNHPLPCGHAKVKDYYKFQFLIRGIQVAPLSKLLGIPSKKEVLKRLIPPKVKFFVDVNPTSTF